MVDTIRPKKEYFFKCSKSDPNVRYLYDGENRILKAELRSIEDYLDEAIDGNNECAVTYEVFTHRNGKQYVYWVDLESDQDFLTNITEATEAQLALIEANIVSD